MIFLLLISDQEDRQWSIREFREGRKDVLVATDVASKGLDFPNIQHVINYDMPTDIENYGECVYKMIDSRFVCNYTLIFIYYVVHRIGRTGRCGKTGIATTFINKMCGKYAFNIVKFCTGPCS